MARFTNNSGGIGEFVDMHDVDEANQIILNRRVIDEHDDAANLWFTFYNVATLAAAFLISTNSTLIENLGFLNFVYSGVLVLLYDSSKYRRNLRFRIIIFKLLRWSMIMLGAAIVSLVLVLPAALYLVQLLFSVDGFMVAFFVVIFSCWIASAYIAWFIDGRVGGFYNRMVDENTFVGISKTDDKDEIRTKYSERILSFVPNGFSLSTLYLIQLLIVTATIQGQGLGYLSTPIFTLLFNPSNILLYILLATLVVLWIWLRRSEERKAIDDLEKKLRELRKGEYLEKWIG